MPRFSLSQMLMVIAAIPVGVGYAEGAGCLSSALFDLLCGDRGWTSSAYDFVASHFGGNGTATYLWLSISISDVPKLIGVTLTCAALGAFRLQAASVAACTLVASIPLSQALSNYLLVGTVFFNLPTYVVPFLGIVISSASWYIGRRLTGHRRATASESRISKKEQFLFWLIVLLILAVSALGWDVFRQLPDMSAIRQQS